ncbi:hypothetical protein NE236_39730, partial [Actinoallomurus purpureus]|nr:hypothetical protein [Actinoallomurus purpureus]
MVWPATCLVNAAPLSMIAVSLDMIAATLHPIASPFPSSGAGETRWQWPLRPRPPVVRRFDPPTHPWEAGHRGVDLAAPPGRP